MSERSNDEQPAVGDTGQGEVAPAPQPTGDRAAGKAAGPGLLLGAWGVVYGDIGTSPLYALKT
ncbi:KUP/HAK/KT family potassium transporter, partial [Micromonospora sicca]|uniref:KUP/HAK/KT family potassium transporter n=1 Tax=Micromonospora sicca TaxID=2202420 RepID=UPI00191C4066